jgi:hypothetical protein
VPSMCRLRGKRYEGLTNLDDACRSTQLSFASDRYLGELVGEIQNHPVEGHSQIGTDRLVRLSPTPNADTDTLELRYTVLQECVWGVVGCQGDKPTGHVTWVQRPSVRFAAV